MAEAPVPRDLHAVLRRPETVRARCAAITHAVADNRSGNFRLDRSRLAVAADRVEASFRSRYPTLVIPYHSRWRHFEAGGIDRKAELDALLADRAPAERARVWFDLTIVSVLLDAAAGSQWRYAERPGAALDAAALPPQRHSERDLMAMLDRSAAGTAAAPPAPAPDDDGAPRYSRSEGLGVATFRAFVGGAFSSEAADPLRADAAVLKQVDAATLRAVFQAGASNPLPGLEGRAGLISRLGEALQAESARDHTEPRPALVFDRLTDGGKRTSVSASELLMALLRTLAPVWRSGSVVMGIPAGDVWPHRWAGGDTGEGGSDRASAGWVPLHRLAQWLAYSLIEPLQWAGVAVIGLESLTGLAEFRNGGLLLDTGVIAPRSNRDLERRWKPADELVVEWRALTVTLLDELAVLLRQRLHASAEQLPLACVLEGTWAAGRELALELRGGAPPINVESDGALL